MVELLKLMHEQDSEKVFQLKIYQNPCGSGYSVKEEETAHFQNVFTSSF